LFEVVVFGWRGRKISVPRFQAQNFDVLKGATVTILRNCGCRDRDVTFMGSSRDNIRFSCNFRNMILWMLGCILWDINIFKELSD
jgi:hypothetical protein